MPKRNLRRVIALAYDRLGMFELGIVTEVFGLPRPELGVKWYDFAVCSVERGLIRATGGVRVQAERGLQAVARAGTIVIPGWRDPDERPPEQLLRALQSAYARGARVVSICSGVFVLAAAGLLDGKRATTHWRYVAKLRSQYPAIQLEPDVLYVDEGRVLTSAGSAAGIDLCLHIVRLDYGADIANRVARRLVMAPHRDGGQAQFVQKPVPETGTPGLAPVLQWLESNFARELPVEALAARAGMSPRTFARQFRQQTGSTPHQWLTHLRLLAAQRRLERTDDSMDQVAEKVGWQTAATLRQHFSRCLDTTPTSYRQKFSTTQK